MADGGVAEGFEEVGLAGAGGAADDEVLVAVDPLEGGQRPLCRRRDRADTVSSQVSKVLPVGNPAAVASGVDRGGLSSGELFGEQGADGFGGFPALRLGGGQHVGGVAAHVRQAELAEQLDDLVGGCDGAGGHDGAPKPSQARVPACSEWASSAERCSPAGWAARIEATSPSAKRP